MLSDNITVTGLNRPSRANKLLLMFDRAYNNEIHYRNRKDRYEYYMMGKLHIRKRGDQHGSTKGKSYQKAA